MNIKIISATILFLTLCGCADNAGRKVGTYIPPHEDPSDPAERKGFLETDPTSTHSGNSSDSETENSYVCKNPEPAACAVEKALAGIGSEFSKPKQPNESEGEE